MNKTISVIVPVYNVASYLPQCLESILNQDYEDLQVLLIDDGSTDDSGAICDRFAAQDSRIQVIHQENGGAASAKNAGLRAASGKYLSFVDSDDYLEPDVYGFLVKILEETQADAVQGAFQEVYRSRREVRPLKPETLEGYDTFSGFPRTFPAPCCGTSSTAGKFSTGSSLRKAIKSTMSILPIRAFCSPGGSFVPTG